MMIKGKADAAAIDVVRALIKQEQAILNQKMAQSTSRMKEIRQQQMSATQKHLDQIVALTEQHNSKIESLEKERLNDITDARREEIEIEIIALEKKKELAERAGEVSKAINSFFEGKGLVLDFKSSATGKFLLDMPGAFASVGAAMSDAIQPANLFAAGMGQMIAATQKLFTSFDIAQASLSQTTATTGEYNDMLYDVQESNKAFNVDVEKEGNCRLT